MLMEEPSLHPAALAVHYLYVTLIVLSIPSSVALTVEDLGGTPEWHLRNLEVFFNCLFTAEVLLRISCAPRPWMLLRSMYTLVDVAAVVPFYAVTVPRLDTGAHPGLELLILFTPIFRLLKVTRHSSGWRILMISIRRVLPPLAVPAFLLLIVVVCSSCAIFWIEKHTAETRELRAFLNVPHAMWFAVVTISTVGYGDVSPTSPEAKMATCALILVGICYMAMPLAIVGSTFSEVWDSRDRVLMVMKVQEKLSQAGIGKDRLEELFSASDADGSGTMKLSEFTHLLEAFHLGMTGAQMTRLFKVIDDNNSGEVCFQEFADFLFPDMEIVDDEVKTPPNSSRELPPCILANPNPNDIPQTDFKLEALDRRVERLEALIGELCAEQRRLFQRLS